jgi:hypothetical protein
VTDTRTLQQLAQEALDVQSACNLSGLVFGWGRAMARFNDLLPGIGTDERNTHPIHVLWSDKCASLTGAQFGHNMGEMYAACERLAAGESEPVSANAG